MGPEQYLIDVDLLLVLFLLLQEVLVLLLDDKLGQGALGKRRRLGPVQRPVLGQFGPTVGGRADRKSVV